MNGLDYAIVAVVATSMLISIFRGFLREAFSIVTWCGAFYVGFTFTDEVAVMLGNIVGSSSFRHLLAFMLLFTLTLLTGSTISHFVVGVLRKTGFGVTDRIIGVAFGFARGVLLVSVVLMMGTFTDFAVTSSVWKESLVVPKFMPVTTWLTSFIPEDVVKALSGENDKTPENKPMDDQKEKISIKQFIKPKLDRLL